MDKIIVFAAGAIIGSFLNVCIYRLPRGKSIIRPGSQCPNCEKAIRWHDNIPVISYIILKGRCRDCGFKIPARYLIVELLTALLLLFFFLIFGMAPRFFAYAALSFCLIIATFVDFEFQEIPDQVSILGLIIGLAASFTFPSLLGRMAGWEGILDSSLGAIAGGGSIYAMGFLGELVFKKEAMGGGDVKLLAMIGAFLGWKLVILTFFIAPVFGSIVGLVLKMKYGRETMPYGPYLSLAALVAILWGDKIIKFLFYGLY